jgi:hypothetical protein
MAEILILDAMDVPYRAGDDVADLLMSFVGEHGRTAYLAGHRLVDRTLEALPRLKRRFGRLACLSNDVARWSVKLR